MAELPLVIICLCRLHKWFRYTEESLESHPPENPLYCTSGPKTLDNVTLTTSRSNQIFENQPATITKSTRRVAHDGRLTPSYLPMLEDRLVMELSYASSPLVPFSSQAQYTTTIPIIPQR